MSQGEAATSDGKDIAIDHSVEPKRVRRKPLKGQALVDFVAALVVRGYQPISIARKAKISVEQATSFRNDMYQHGIQAAYGDLTTEERQRLKVDLRNHLLTVLDDTKDAVRQSRKRGEIKTRAHTHGNSAVKLLMAMYGLNAPTQTVNVDLKAEAFVNPEVTARFLKTPKAIAAMLAMEEALSEYQGSPEAEESRVIDVTSDRGDVE